MQRVGGHFPMTDSEVKSQAKGLRKVIANMAATTRYLYELYAGRSAVDNEPAVTPQNPQGLIGIDCSGPPWGQAKLHPIAVMGGHIESANAVCLPPVIDSLPKDTKKTLQPWPFWVRPFDSPDGVVIPPYSRGLLVVRAWRETGAVDVDVTVTARNHTLGDDAERRSGTFTILGATAAGTETTYAVGGFWIDLTPGENEVELSFEHANNNPISINSLMIYNGEKLSH